MNKKWSLLHASGIGKREYNDDFVLTSTLSASRRRYFVLVACDGVGSNPGSGACAKAVSEISVKCAEEYVKGRGTHRALDNFDAREFAKALEEKVSILNGSADHSTTACVIIFDKDSLICAWAGDTRAYYLDIDGALQRITPVDHHDDDGRLTRFITGDGYVESGFEFVAFRILPSVPLVALIAITDGIHGRCSFDDLRRLLAYLTNSPPQNQDALDDIVSLFLDKFVDDNYSIAIFLRILRSGYLHRLNKGANLFG